MMEVKGSIVLTQQDNKNSLCRTNAVIFSMIGWWASGWRG